MKNKTNILIVEDSKTQAEKLKYILQSNGYEVNHASNTNNAIEYLNQNTPDVIISDIIMPGKDGYEFCKELKSNNSLKNIPVILLTSLSDPSDIIKGINSGADSFITKPYSENFLLSKIEYLITNFKIRTKADSEISFEVYFAGKKHIINSSHLQMIDLLFSTYENAVIKNEELRRTNNELKQTQTQLLHAKKMASLGILTAGIAHEINNPINFIYSGINSLKQDIDEIMPIIKMCNKISNGNLEYLDKLKELKADTELDEIIDTIPQTIDDIKYGAQRTTEIIKGLRNFSRVDPSNKQATYIHEGIESTLLLLKHKLAPNIEIIKDFDNNIPKIFAFAGELNQVFMNLISNAIDAINSMQSGNDGNEVKGKIKIVTKLVSENQIHITITDNGHGIPQEIKDNIFDPFFTTKEIGQGTGLGLAITHGIIEKHNGKIRVQSKVGEGTKFTIQLPVLIEKTIKSSML